MKRIFIVLLVLGGLFVAVVVAALMYVGLFGPETYVVSGNQVKSHQLRIIKKLELLQEDEKIQYFYSDALVDIRKGMYFVTDKRLVLYEEDWATPKVLADFSQIVGVEAEFSDHSLVDSEFTVKLKNGEELSFPVSCERKRDRKFFEYLQSRIPKEGDAPKE